MSVKVYRVASDQNISDSFVGKSLQESFLRFIEEQVVHSLVHFSDPWRPSCNSSNQLMKRFLFINSCSEVNPGEMAKKAGQRLVIPWICSGQENRDNAKRLILHVLIQSSAHLFVFPSPQSRWPEENGASLTIIQRFFQSSSPRFARH